ncbi:MAG: Mth938-like domain-containing protein [Spirochaetales bacterium]|nr:Mth938-like domain-containing protein [Spirochaetales bacterium]
MKPVIDGTKFGSITVSGKRYEYDIVIGLDGSVGKREKKLSKAVFGTSHKISIEEAEYIYEDGADKLIVGTGQSGLMELSKEAEQYFKVNSCSVNLLPTPEAIKMWNNENGNVIGLFHVTC